MKLMTLVLIGLVTFVIAWQDIKSRTVHVLVLVSFLACAILFHFYVRPIETINLLLNGGFLLILFLLGGFLIKVIYRKNPLQAIGAGDLIYLIITVLFFQFPSFVVWFNVSIILTLLFHLTLKYFHLPSKKSQERIPLAAYLSIFFVISVFIEAYVGRLGSII